MANKNVELMRGAPEIAVKKLAIPIMISMLLTASYNIIDGIWVAGLGQAAIAGIGFVTPIFIICLVVPGEQRGGVDMNPLLFIFFILFEFNLINKNDYRLK